MQVTTAVRSCLLHNNIILDHSGLCVFDPVVSLQSFHPFIEDPFEKVVTLVLPIQSVSHSSLSR